MIKLSSAATSIPQKNAKNYRISETTDKLRQHCQSNTAQDSTKQNNLTAFWWIKSSIGNLSLMKFTIAWANWSNIRTNFPRNSQNNKPNGWWNKSENKRSKKCDWLRKTYWRGESWRESISGRGRRRRKEANEWEWRNGEAKRSQFLRLWTDLLR